MTEAPFDAPAMQAYRGAGEEPEFVSPDSPMPNLTADEKARGFVVFQVNWMERTFPITVPQREQIIDTLSVRAAPGEYEPVTFLIRPQQDLKNMSVSIAGDLEGPNGMRIAGDNVRLGIVNGWTKYGSYTKPIRAAIAPILKPVDIGKDYSEQFWVTVEVPAEAQPGMYQGKIRIHSNGSVKHELALNVEVLPIALLKPDIPFGMFFDHQRIPPQFATANYMGQYYRDMADHGMNSVSFHTMSGIIDNNRLVVDPQKNYKLPKDDPRHNVGLAVMMELAEKAGLLDAGFPVLYVGGYTDYRELEKRWKELNMPWPSATPSPGECAQIADFAKEQGWPELLFYLMDEVGGIAPFTGARTMLWEREAIRAMHAAGLRTANAQGYFLYRKDDYLSWYVKDRKLDEHELVTNENGDIVDEFVLENIYHYLDVCLFSTSMGMHEKVFDNMRSLKKDYWAYDCIHPAIEPENDRFMYGVYCRRIGTKGFFQWHYMQIEETKDGKNYWAWMDDDGVFHNMGDYGPLYIVPSPLGPIPTLSWEAKREGIDDYRYMITLDALIAKAEAEGNESAKKLAAEARATVDEMIAKIPIDPYRRRRDAVGAGYVKVVPEIATADYDQFRRTLADFIMRIDHLMNTSSASIDGDVLR